MSAAVTVQAAEASTPAALHLQTIAEGSRRSVASSLHRAAKIAEGHPHANGIRYPWHRATGATLGAVRAGLANGYAPASANASLAGIRGAVRQAWITGEISREGMERRYAALKAVRGQSAPGRALSAVEVAKLFTACAKDTNRPAAARDGALIAGLYGLGLRRAECARAALADLDLTAGRWRIHGKGRRQRWAFLVNGARAAVEGWLRHRGSEPGPLFARVYRSGRIVEGSGMSGEAIRLRVALRAREAGLGRVAPHLLRASFATALLGAGNDLAVTADLMGHARTDTTRLYDRRGEDAAKQAASTIPVPYQAPR